MGWGRYLTRLRENLALEDRPFNNEPQYVTDRRNVNHVLMGVVLVLGSLKLDDIREDRGLQTPYCIQVERNYTTIPLCPSGTVAVKNAPSFKIVATGTAAADSLELRLKERK